MVLAVLTLMVASLVASSLPDLLKNL